MTDLGKAYVQIIPSAQGISKAIQKGVGADVTTSGMSLGKVLGASLIKSFAALGIGTVISKSLSLGGELEQNLGGTEAVFGKYAENIQEIATKSYKNMGLSASDYMSTANKMASLFQGSGLSQQRSLELTSSAMQRAADVASVMGIDTTMAMESIAGAAKGNYTMMDNLGVAMNATTLQAYALEKGVNFNWNTASNAQKAELAMKMFMERTGQYQGNFAKESEETFSGSLGMMKSSFENFLANLSTGGDISGTFINLTTSVLGFGKNVIKMLWNILKSIPTIIITAVTEGVPLLLSEGGKLLQSIITGFISYLPIAMETIKGFINNIGIWISEYIPMIFTKGIELLSNFISGISSKTSEVFNQIAITLQGMLTKIIENLPKWIQKGKEIISSMITGLKQSLPNIISTILNMLSNLLSTITNNLSSFISKGIAIISSIIKGIWNMRAKIIKGMFDVISAVIKTIANILPEFLKKGLDLVSQLIKGIWNKRGKLLSIGANLIKSLLNTILQSIKGIFSIGSNLVKGLWNGITSVKSWILSKIRGFGNSILSSIKGFFGIHSPSKVFRDEIGANLVYGLADGITGNLRPVSQAMDKLENEAMRDFSSSFGVNSPYNYGIDSGFVSNNLHATLNLGNHEYKLLVQDFTDEQNKQTQLELSY